MKDVYVVCHHCNKRFYFKCKSCCLQQTICQRCVKLIFEYKPQYSICTVPSCLSSMTYDPFWEPANKFSLTKPFNSSSQSPFLFSFENEIQSNNTPSKQPFLKQNAYGQSVRRDGFLLNKSNEAH